MLKTVTIVQWLAVILASVVIGGGAALLLITQTDTALLSRFNAGVNELILDREVERAEKDAELAEKDVQIAEKDVEIALRDQPWIIIPTSRTISDTVSNISFSYPADVHISTADLSGSGAPHTINLIGEDYKDYDERLVVVSLDRPDEEELQDGSTETPSGFDAIISDYWLGNCKKSEPTDENVIRLFLECSDTITSSVSYHMLASWGENGTILQFSYTGKKNAWKDVLDSLYAHQ